MIQKKPSFENYPFNEASPSIELTMEATGVSREEAIKILKELSYRVNYPTKKKKKLIHK